MFWSRDIKINTKKIIYNTIIKSILPYGAETWRISKTNEKKLFATQMIFRDDQQEFPDWNGKQTSQFEIC